MSADHAIFHTGGPVTLGKAARDSLPVRLERSGRLPVHAAVFLLRSALGLGGGLVCAWELNRQASGPGWRKPRVLSAVAALLLVALLAI